MTVVTCSFVAYVNYPAQSWSSAALTITLVSVGWPSHGNVTHQKQYLGSFCKVWEPDPNPNLSVSLCLCLRFIEWQLDQEKNKDGAWGWGWWCSFHTLQQLPNIARGQVRWNGKTLFGGSQQINSSIWCTKNTWLICLFARGAIANEFNDPHPSTHTHTLLSVFCFVLWTVW